MLRLIFELVSMSSYLYSDRMFVSRFLFSDSDVFVLVASNRRRIGHVKGCGAVGSSRSTSRPCTLPVRYRLTVSALPRQVWHRSLLRLALLLK